MLVKINSSSFKDSHSYPIHTYFPIIDSNDDRSFWPFDRRVTIIGLKIHLNFAFTVSFQIVCIYLSCVLMRAIRKMWKRTTELEHCTLSTEGHEKQKLETRTRELWNHEQLQKLASRTSKLYPEIHSTKRQKKFHNVLIHLKPIAVWRFTMHTSSDHHQSLTEHNEYKN